MGEFYEIKKERSDCLSVWSDECKSQCEGRLQVDRTDARNVESGKSEQWRSGRNKCCLRLVEAKHLVRSAATGYKRSAVSCSGQFRTKEEQLDGARSGTTRTPCPDRLCSRCGHWSAPHKPRPSPTDRPFEQTMAWFVLPVRQAPPNGVTVSVGWQSRANPKRNVH
jgi:hypothetical protein